MIPRMLCDCNGLIVEFSAENRFVGTLTALCRHCSSFVGTHIILRNVLSSAGSIQLGSIDIDTQINFAADKFGLTKTIGLDFSHDAWNTAAPMLNKKRKRYTIMYGE